MLDLIVLVLPMPMIWKLQLKLGKKIQLSFIFLLGYRYVYDCAADVQGHSLIAISSAFVGLARFSIVASNPPILNDATDKDLTCKPIPRPWKML